MRIKAAALTVTVDLAILTLRDGFLHVVVVERGTPPFLGALALPGGFVEVGESLDHAAQRELEEETGLDLSQVHVEQLGSYGDPGRDPRGWTVTVCYVAFMPDLPLPTAGGDARATWWAPVEDLLADPGSLAFDHHTLLSDAVERARSKLEYTTLGASFCPPVFTIADLRQVYEAVWGYALDPSNFHRKVTGVHDFLIPTGDKTPRTKGRPAALYRRGPATLLHPAILRSHRPNPQTTNSRRGTTSMRTSDDHRPAARSTTQVAVICTALDLEYDAVLEHLTGELVELEERGTLYEVGAFRGDAGTWKVALVQTEPGNTTAGMELERAITVFSPQVVMFVGVAGGRRDLSLGDVVAADAVYDYETGKDTEDGFLPRIKTQPPSHRIVQRAKSVARRQEWLKRIQPPHSDPPPRAIVKPIAAGSKVVAHKRSLTARHLEKNCGDAVAVDMESHGFLRGAYLNANIDALVVRGISDLLTDKSEASDRQWQPIAARHAAAFAFEILARFVPSSIDAMPVPQQLPAEIPTFTGRSRDLDALDTLYADHKKGPRVVVISGPAGIGKTALATHAAHRLAPRHPDGQLFIDLHGHTQGVAPIDPAKAVGQLLQALGVPEKDIPPAIDAAAALYRSRVAGRRILIMLDNATNENQVQPLLPGTSGCSVLITSRHRLTGLDQAIPVILDVLPPSEAVALFTRVAGDLSLGDTKTVEEIVQLCGRLPLAISIAAARLRARPTWTLPYLADRLREHNSRLAELEAGQRSLAAAIDLSYMQLDPEQQRVFRLIGLHPGADTDAYAVAAVADMTTGQAEHVLEGLLDVSLVQQHQPGRYQLHDLLRIYAARRAADDPEAAQRVALTRLFTHYLEFVAAAQNIISPFKPRNRSSEPSTALAPFSAPADARAWVETELRTLVTIVEYTAEHGWPTHTIHLAAALAEPLLHSRALRTDAHTVHAHALRAARDQHDRAGEAIALYNLGILARQDGRHDEARNYCTQSLTIRREIGDRSGEASTLDALGTLDQIRGSHTEALGHHTQALIIAREIGDRAIEDDILHNLGKLYLQQMASPADALECFQQSLAIRRELGDRSGEASTLNAIAAAYDALGDHHKALDRFQQALAIRHELDDRSGEAAILANLGAYYRRRTCLNDALDCLHQALGIYRGLGDNTNVLAILFDLGHTYHTAGSLEHATTHYELALSLAAAEGHRNAQAAAYEALASVNIDQARRLAEPGP